MLFVTDEQRQILKADGVPMPLIDGEGKCYIVMPVTFSYDRGESCFQARMAGFGAVAEAEVPSDAAMILAILVRKMLEQE